MKKHSVAIIVKPGKSIYVTRFVKTCIVHTSKFSILKINKFCYDKTEACRVIMELLLKICILLLPEFMNL